MQQCWGLADTMIVMLCVFVWHMVGLLGFAWFAWTSQHIVLLFGRAVFALLIDLAAAC